MHEIAPSAAAATPSVLIVILSFNCPSDTFECLDSLSRQTYPNMRVLIVDNASTDGAAAAIRARFPDIGLLQLDENHGWAGGNNAGITRGLDRKFEWLCLLNNDTVLTINAIAAMVSAAQSLGPCLLHPAIYYYDHPEQAQLDPAAGVSMGLSRRLEDRAGVFDLDFAYGACLMVHAEIFRRIGILDERFFLQLEESDFYHRARRAGFRSYCLTSVRILHKVSRAFGGRRTPVKTYYGVRNSLLLAEKHNQNLHDWIRTIKGLYWGLSETAGLRGRRVAFLCWVIFSGDRFARAARAGALDYVFRRFGPLRNAATKTWALPINRVSEI